MPPEAHHLQVTRTARYYVLGTPAAHVSELWIVCHGYGQLAGSFIAAFEPIAHDDRVIAAPEALNRYYIDTAPRAHGPDAAIGATWMTREDRAHEIADYIAYLDTLAAHLQADMPHARITALGFSQGTATVSRWAAAGTTQLHRVILWGGSIAHDVELRPDLLRGAALTLVVGNRDEHVSAERLNAERARLDAAGLHHTLVQFAGGHRIEAATLHALSSG